jgi:hypothetical protein
MIFNFIELNFETFSDDIQSHFHFIELRHSERHSRIFKLLWAKSDHLFYIYVYCILWLTLRHLRARWVLISPLFDFSLKLSQTSLSLSLSLSLLFLQLVQYTWSIWVREDWKNESGFSSSRGFFLLIMILKAFLKLIHLQLLISHANIAARAWVVSSRC